MLSGIKNWSQSGLTYAVKGVSFLEKASGVALAVIIIFLLLLICSSVVARYFIKPIQGDYDIVAITVPVLAFLGVAFCQKVRGHLRIEFIINKFKGRVYHFFESLWLVIAICVFVILAVYTTLNAVNAYQTGDVTAYTLFPTWYTRFLIAIGCILICFRLVIQLVQNLVQLVKGGERKDLNESRLAA